MSDTTERPKQNWTLESIANVMADTMVKRLEPVMLRGADAIFAAANVRITELESLLAEQDAKLAGPDATHLDLWRSLEIARMNAENVLIGGGDPKVLLETIRDATETMGRTPRAFYDACFNAYYANLDTARPHFGAALLQSHAAGVPKFKPDSALGTGPASDGERTP